LLQGSVKVDLGGESKLLRPGQQAQISSGIQVSDDVNVEEVMAWKNGEFQFGEAADINAIMRQISRWYDVTIEYRGEITGHIGGTISRDESASQVLKMLEMTGAVKFEIQGNKIIVSSTHL
jgi:ferric-dicitrate binding protein FerR (iron transport regulator)